MADAPIIKWETTIWTYNIRRIQCERESKHAIWVMEEWLPGDKEVCKRLKSAGRVDYHDTWEDAHAYLMGRAEERLAASRRYLVKAEEDYQRCLHMTKPAEPESEAPTRESGD